MSAVEFPRGMSIKKADRWLAANNPYRGEGRLEYLWASRFWVDQADKNSKKANRALLVAMVLLAISVAIQIARLVLS